MSRYNFLWSMSCLLVCVDGSGCASSGSCMRHTDCSADARCIDGTCTVPPEASAGSAGVSGGSTDAENGGAAGGAGGNAENTGGTSNGGATTAKGGTVGTTAGTTSTGGSATGSST
ncbi:MAG: hypothetical protein QM784_06640 [Polyangiaceae bacterium]